MAKGGFNTPLLLLILFLAGSIGLVVTQGPATSPWNAYEPVGAMPGQRFKVEFPTPERPQKKIVQRRSTKYGAFQETTYELSLQDEKYSVIVMPYTPEAIAAKNKEAGKELGDYQTFFCQNMSPPWQATAQSPTTDAAGNTVLDYSFTFNNAGKLMGGKARLILTKACQYHLTAVSTEDPDDPRLQRFLDSFEPLADQPVSAPPAASKAPAKAPAEDPAPEAPEAPEAE